MITLFRAANAALARTIMPSATSLRLSKIIDVIKYTHKSFHCLLDNFVGMLRVISAILTFAPLTVIRIATFSYSLLIIEIMFPDLLRLRCLTSEFHIMTFFRLMITMIL
jgi:hypothetical protein